MKYLCLLIVALFSVATSLAEEPTIVILNSDVTEDSPISLSCGDVNTIGENDTLVWIYTDAKETNHTEDSTLTYNITDETKTGQYDCYFNNALKALYLATKLTTPVILNTRHSVTYNDGDTNRKLTCESSGSYPDPEFIWMRRGENENEAPVLVKTETNPNYDIQTNGTKSVLKFYNVTYSESAVFICDIKNIAGNDTVEVLVRVKDKYAAVWPFLGIVIEVVILIAIIFLYERHSKKADMKDDLVVDADDVKPLNRDEGMEIRNRKDGKDAEKS